MIFKWLKPVWKNSGAHRATLYALKCKEIKNLHAIPSSLILAQWEASARIFVFAFISLILFNFLWLLGCSFSIFSTETMISKAACSLIEILDLNQGIQQSFGMQKRAPMFVIWIANNFMSLYNFSGSFTRGKQMVKQKFHKTLNFFCYIQRNVK